jgi:peptidoglycan/xylan/chitin deacetylase (PgdA/CDA1 family)
VLAPAEAIDHIADGGPRRGTSALITFDDGYRDNFEVAAPILRQLGVPATFFLPTAFLEAPRLPWWDEVARILKRTRARRLELPRRPDDDGPAPSPLRIDLDAVPRPEAIRSVIAAFLDETIRDGPWFLGMLADRAEVAGDDGVLARDLFADWDLVRRATGPGTGLSVGSHGHSHRKLAGLVEYEQLRELADSRRILRDRLGRDVEALAYPYGWPGAYTDATRALAARAGYRAAFAAVEGLNRPGSTDPFAIRRLNVGSGDTPVLLRARAALHATLGRSFL